MYVTSILTGSIVILGLASASPLSKRAFIDFSQFPSDVERDALVSAQIGAVRLARTALDALGRTNAGSDRIYKLYFPADEHTKSRVQTVFNNIAGDPRVNEATGSPSLGNFVAAPAGESANCADGYTLAKTSDVEEGNTTIELCPRYFSLKALSGEGGAQDICKQTRKMSDELDNLDSILLQQFTYAKAIGETDDVLVSDKTYEAYSLAKAQALAQSKPELAVISADNYKWFALHTYLQETCAEDRESL